MENVGQAVVDRLYRTMMIDDEWSTRRDSEFTWWGYELAQRVAASPMRQSNAYRVSTVSAVTDLVTDTAPDRTLPIANELNRGTALSSYVIGKDGSTISAVTSAVFHSENLWMERLFSIAAATQVAEAHALSHAIAGMTGGKVAVSSHTLTGARAEPDDMLGVIFGLPGRAEVVPFTAEEFAGSLEIGPAMWVRANADEHGATVEYPWDPANSSAGTVLLAVSEVDKEAESSRIHEGPYAEFLSNLHSTPASMRYGSGLLFKLGLPVVAKGMTGMLVAAQLNALEAQSDVAFHRLGGWYGDDEGVWHTAFFPNVCFVPLNPRQRQITLYNLLSNCAAQVRWASKTVRAGEGS